MTEKILLKDLNGHCSIRLSRSFKLIIIHQWNVQYLSNKIHCFFLILGSTETMLLNDCIFSPNASLTLLLCLLFSYIFKLLFSFLFLSYVLFLSSTCPISKAHRLRVTMTFNLWPLLGASHQPPRQKGSDLNHWDVTCSILQSLFCAHPLLQWHHKTHQWMSPDCSDPTSPAPLQTLQCSLLGIFNTLLIITL